MHAPKTTHFDDAFLKSLVKDPLRAVSEYYARCLDSTPKAREFLAHNALELAGDIEHELGVGFVSRTLGTNIPKRTSKVGSEIRDKLASMGVYRANGREHFRGMVTAPLQSVEDGSVSVSGMYGLRIDRNGDGPAEQHIGQGIFNAEALLRFNELIICGSVRDAWALIAAGHRNAVCLVEGAWPAAALQRVKRVILTAPQIELEQFSHCETFALELPEGLSAHEYALAHSEEPDPFAEFIRNAPWLKAPVPTPIPIAAEKPAATPVPTRPEEELEVEATDTQITIGIESRSWRIQGLERNRLPGVLRVNVLVRNQLNDCFHVDTFDLYHARSRRSFLSEAAEELGESESVIRADMGRVLLKLEQLQHERLSATTVQGPEKPQLSAEDESAAMGLLRDEQLLDRILEDFERCGIVGERNGKLAGYLVATSRLLEKPLGLIVQSSSAAGKSSLTNAILGFMPDEARFECSAMTSQSLYYLGQQDLRHRILSIAEEEGVRSASYGLKLLQSEGRLSLISAQREKATGRLSTQRYEVEGPVSLMLTTTASDLDPELMNRCLVVGVDESESQTTAIQTQQRFARTLTGFQQTQLKQSLVNLHQNAQRLLRPLRVHNPYAQQLTFAGYQTRFRRDHEKYLTLINTVTLLHQYQREVQSTELNGQPVEYLEVTREDIARANRIAKWALGRSVDELPGPTRRLLCQLFEWTERECKRQGVSQSGFKFTRRQAREALRWNSTHFREHLERLVHAEYVIPHGRAGQGKLHRYSLLYDGWDCQGERSVLGLIDAEALSEPGTTQSAPMPPTWH